MIITSLRSKIRVVFSVTLLLLGALFIFSIKYDHAMIEERNIAQEQAISHYLYSYYLKYGKIDEAYLEAQNVSLITDKGMVVQIERFFKEKGELKRYAVDTFRLKRIIIINNDRFKLILENKNKPQFPIKRVLIFSTVFLLIIFLYLWIMKSLQPLSVLKSQIKTFSKGNLDIECKSDKEDEIAEVANEFDHAVTMIRELLHSRQLFLRAIMHELKTPITKGRIVVEMMEDEANKKILVRAFERMNELISELAEIERVTTQSFEPTFEYVMLDEVIRRSQELLMMPKGNVTVDVKNIALATDIKLLSLAIKNLMDNGIKYSKDKHVTIKSVGDSLEISSKGEKLQHPLSYYVEPFSQGEKRSSGFGLGLYIVHNILEKLGCGLDYKYIDGYNIFVIKAGDACRFG